MGILKLAVRFPHERRTEISPFLSFSSFFPNNGSHWQKMFFFLTNFLTKLLTNFKKKFWWSFWRIFWQIFWLIYWLIFGNFLTNLLTISMTDFWRIMWRIIWPIFSTHRRGVPCFFKSLWNLQVNSDFV